MKKSSNEGHPRFLQLLNEIRALHIAKSAGYAGQDNPDIYANFRKSALFGVSPFVGCMVRMSDKFIRAANLTRNPSNDQVSEPLIDTLMDLAAYALIGICLYEEQTHLTKPQNTKE